MKIKVLKSRIQRHKKAKIICVSLAFWLVIILALMTLSACAGESVAKIYRYNEDGEKKLLKNVTEKDEDFLIDLINNNYLIGYATGEEKADFELIYNQGTENEYVYKLIVNLETDVLTYITDDNDGITAPRVYNSNITSLEFYDFLAKLK